MSAYAASFGLSFAALLIAVGALCFHFGTKVGANREYESYIAQINGTAEEAAKLPPDAADDCLGLNFLVAMDCARAKTGNRSWVYATFAPRWMEDASKRFQDSKQKGTQ